MRNIFKVSLVIFLLLIVFNYSFAMGRQIKENVVLNSQSPDFTLNDIGGGKITLSDFKNKNNVLLLFWFTSCPFCLREINKLEKIYPEIRNDDLKFFSVDIADSVSTIKRYLKESSITFPVLLDSNSAVALKYNLVGVPTYVLIDKQGVVRSITNDFPKNYKEILAK